MRAEWTRVRWDQSKEHLRQRSWCRRKRKKSVEKGKWRQRSAQKWLTATAVAFLDASLDLQLSVSEWFIFFCASGTSSRFCTFFSNIKINYELYGVEELDACVKWVWTFKKSRFELSIKNTQRKFWCVSIKKWLLITSRMQFGILIFGGSGFEQTTNWGLFPLNDVVSPLRNKA